MGGWHLVNMFFGCKRCHPRFLGAVLGCRHESQRKLGRDSAPFGARKDNYPRECADRGRRAALAARKISFKLIAGVRTRAISSRTPRLTDARLQDARSARRTRYRSEVFSTGNCRWPRRQHLPRLLAWACILSPRPAQLLWPKYRLKFQTKSHHNSPSTPNSSSA